MANSLWLYVTPTNSTIQLIADNGVSAMGIPQMHEGRDAQLLEIPFDTDGIGCRVIITSEGYHKFEGRAVLLTHDSNAWLNMDDFYLVKVEEQQPVPIPPPAYHGEPEEIIRQVYEKTGADLSTHDGCGKFTEDVATALHDANSQWWGHIRKNPGQNQYNGHAVDAIMLATGIGSGIYDIIHDSVSPNATPAYNYKGPPDLDIWYYPA